MGRKYEKFSFQVFLLFEAHGKEKEMKKKKIICDENNTSQSFFLSRYIQTRKEGKKDGNRKLFLKISQYFARSTMCTIFFYRKKK